MDESEDTFAGKVISDETIVGQIRRCTFILSAKEGAYRTVKTSSIED